MKNSLSNAHLSLHADEFGNINVTQNKNGRVWHGDQEEYIPGMIYLESGAIINLKEAKKIEIKVQDNHIDCLYEGFIADNKRIDGCLKTVISLEDDAVVFRVVSLELPVALSAIEYPYRAFALYTWKDEGNLVLPYFHGCLIPTGKKVKLDTVPYWFFTDNTRSESAQGVKIPTMPVFGAYAAGTGYAAIMETGEDSMYAYMANSDEATERFVAKGERSPFARRSVAWPHWLANRGKLGYERTVRYQFAQEMDYVKIAKIYREYAKKSGLLRTLHEKAQSHPQLMKIKGAPLVAYYAGYPHMAPPHPSFEYKYSELNDAIQNLNRSGVSNAFIHFWGGFKTQPPLALPFDEAPGRIAELRSVVKQTDDLGYLFSFYTDLSALIEEGTSWDPSLLRVERDGKFATYRWRRTCQKLYKQLAEKTFPQLIEQMGIKASYIDCINGNSLLECYSDEHPMDRREDLKSRIELFRYLHEKGLIFGGEHLSWWAVPEVEYSSCAGMHGACDRILASYPIPLFQLVFHDCVISYPQAADDYTREFGAGFETKILRDVLTGVPPIFYINLRDAASWHQSVVDAYNATYPVLEHIAFAPMTHHQMSEDGKIQESEFEDVTVRVNFDNVEREGLKPRSYLAKVGGKEISMTCRRDIKVTM